MYIGLVQYTVYSTVYLQQFHRMISVVGHLEPVANVGGQADLQLLGQLLLRDVIHVKVKVKVLLKKSWPYFAPCCARAFALRTAKIGEPCSELNTIESIVFFVIFFQKPLICKV